jgi:hypothetical protein
VDLHRAIADRAGQRTGQLVVSRSIFKAADRAAGRRGIRALK